MARFPVGAGCGGGHVIQPHCTLIVQCLTLYHHATVRVVSVARDVCWFFRLWSFRIAGVMRRATTPLPFLAVGSSDTLACSKPAAGCMRFCCPHAHSPIPSSKAPSWPDGGYPSCRRYGNHRTSCSSPMPRADCVSSLPIWRSRAFRVLARNASVLPKLPGSWAWARKAVDACGRRARARASSSSTVHSPSGYACSISSHGLVWSLGRSISMVDKRDRQVIRSVHLSTAKARKYRCMQSPTSTSDMVYS